MPSHKCGLPEHGPVNPTHALFCKTVLGSGHGGAPSGKHEATTGRVQVQVPNWQMHVRSKVRGLPAQSDAMYFTAWHRAPEKLHTSPGRIVSDGGHMTPEHDGSAEQVQNRFKQAQRTEVITLGGALMQPCAEGQMRSGTVQDFPP